MYSYIEERITDACLHHLRAHVCVHVSARVCVCSGAHVSAPKRVGAFRRRGSRVVRLAGVPVGVGVQREHRRVEHRIVDGLDQCMRRFPPAACTAGCGGSGRRVFDAARPKVCDTPTDVQLQLMEETTCGHRYWL